MHESEKWKWSHSVMSDSSRPHGLQPTRLLRPWDFPGKRTGVGCHCLLRSALLQGLFNDNHYIINMCLSRFSRVRLFATLWIIACQAPLSMGFSRCEYWSVLPCPPPGNLPDPGMESKSPLSPALQVDSLPISHWRSPLAMTIWWYCALVSVSCFVCWASWMCVFVIFLEF